jgi:flagella basal body P-ring formation protein FlgA
MLSIILIVTSLFIQSGDSLNTDLDKYLKKNLSQYEGFDYKILQIPADYKKIGIMEDRDFNLCGNLVYIPVEVVTKSSRIIKSIITVRVKLYKNALIAARQIEKNHNFSVSDFETKKVDFTQIKGSLLISTEGIENFRTKIFLRKGEPVLKENIEPKPIILTGDAIEARLTTGSVTVTFSALSRQDGIPGGIILIMSKDKKQYKAKVIDSHNVIIIE